MQRQPRLFQALAQYKTVFGHVRVPRVFVVPQSSEWPESMWGSKLGQSLHRLRILGKVTPLARRLAQDLGFDINAKPPGFQHTILALQVFHGIHGHYRVPSRFVVPEDAAYPSEMWGKGLGRMYNNLIKSEAFKVYHPALEEAGVPIETMEQQHFAANCQAYRWYFDTFGSWRIPKSYIIPNDPDITVDRRVVEIPKGIRGMKVGVRWFEFVHRGRYNDPQFLDQLDKLEIPSPRNMRNPEPEIRNHYGTSAPLKDVMNFCKAFVWFQSTYGHWDIPFSYVVPKSPKITVDGKSVPVPAKIRSLAIGRRWYGLIKEGYYACYWELFPSLGIPYPSTAEKLIEKHRATTLNQTHLRKQMSWKERQFRCVCDGFVWFHNVYGHWAIKKNVVIPNEESVVVDGKEHSIPTALRGMPVGVRWYALTKRGLYREFLYLLQEYGVPQPPSSEGDKSESTGASDEDTE